MDEIKKAGRPAKHGQAMTPALRMKEYRRRQRLRREQASDKPEGATDRFLAECLTEAFKRAHPDPSVQQYLIEKYLQELCNRYKITPKK